MCTHGGSHRSYQILGLRNLESRAFVLRSIVFPVGYLKKVVGQDFRIDSLFGKHLVFTFSEK
jgi:hypothetical protein